MGTPVWRQGLAAVVSAILILEAGAFAPASSVLGTSSAGGAARHLDAPQSAPNDPPSKPEQAHTTSVVCDDFERANNPDSWGSGGLGTWQAWNPPGDSSIVNGEGSLIWDGSLTTIRYIDRGSIPLPFELYLKHRAWIAGAPSEDNLTLSIYAGVSTTPGFGTQPPGDYYFARYLHGFTLARPGRWLDYYARALVGNQTGWTTDSDASPFVDDYADGTTFYTRLRVFSGDQVYIKHWVAGEAEPAAFVEWPIQNPSSGPMRYIVVRNWPSYPLAEPPDPVADWRIDEICLDTAPPPVMVTEDIPDETEWNDHPNTETSGDPVNTFNGSLTTEVQDAVILGRGPAIDFRRTYNSNDPRVGPLGPAWTHSYATRLRLADDESGDLYLIGPEGRGDRYTLQPDGTFTPPPGIHTQLQANPDGTFTATDKDQSTRSFDIGGRLTSIADRYGNTSSLTYGAGGRLVSISDPAGRGSLALAYTSGRLTSITDWASPARVVTYQYDGSGRLWKVTDREGKTTTYTYDGTSHRIATITDPRGNVALTNTYDPQGRVATQKDARGLVTGDVTTYGYALNPDGTRETTITAPPTSFAPSFTPSLTDSYDATGWLVQRVTRPSSTETLTQSFTYDADGDRTSATDARGNRTDFCYDVNYAGAPIAGSAGNLTRRIDPASTTGADRPVTLIAHDAKHNVIQTVAPEGVPSGTTVTCASDLSAISTAHAVDFTYDAAGVALLATTERFTDPDLGLRTAITKYEYGDAANPGLITRLIPPRGNTALSPDYTYATTLSYFATGSTAGLLKDLTDPLGNRTSFAYDAVGRLTSTVDPLGNAAGGVPAEHTTTLSYDQEDRLRFRALPAPVAGAAGLTEETRYDAAGNPTARIDANGQVSTFTYDERNSLASVTESTQGWTDPAAPPAAVIVTEYDHDAGGNVTRVTRAAGDSQHERVTDYAYDGRGLFRSETQYPAWPSTAGPLVTATSYDANGLPLTTTDPLGQTTTRAYDALNRLTAIDYSDTSTPDVAYAYDANGNRTSMADGSGTTTYQVDEAGQIVTVTSPGPTTVGYRYDLDGKRTKLIYPDATAVTYTWNKGGQLASLLDWASRSVSYTYAPDGLVRTTTNPDGSVATHTYDNARRLVDILHTGASSAVLDRFAYTLDAAGNVTDVANGSLRPQFARPDGLTGSNGTWTGSYASIDEAPASDADFLASPSGPTTSNYYEISLSNVSEPHVPTGITVRYRYAKSGNNSGKTTNLTVELRQGATVIASQAHPNIPGVTGSGWQAGSFTLTTAEANAVTNFADLRLRFRPSSSGGGQTRSAQISWGEIELASAGDPATHIAYSYDRLYRLTGVDDAGGTETYSYDPVGDRLTVGGMAYTYDRADRMTAAGATSITVDANGNLTAKGADSFAFDQANRLTSASVDGVTETYAYDGDGTRVSRQVGASPAIEYVSDLAGGLPVTIDDGSRKYVYGLGLAYAVAGSSIEVYQADHLGSVRSLTDGAGSVVATYGTDAWGIPTVSTGSSTQPFGFTGEPRDASGLSYLRARYFDAELGRFLSRDSWAGGATAPQSLNRYAYVTNNPVRYTDPSGRCGIDLIADIGFSLFSLGQVIFGPEKERAENLGYLALDVGGVIIPCGAGMGMLARGARTTDTAEDAIGGGFMGHRGYELGNAPYQPARNTGTTIGDRTFTGHALDQMQNRGIMPTVVENAIQVGTPFATRPGTRGYYDPVNDLQVITNDIGEVVTVIWGSP